MMTTRRGRTTKKAIPAFTGTTQAKLSTIQPANLHLPRTLLHPLSLLNHPRINAFPHVVAERTKRSLLSAFCFVSVHSYLFFSPHLY